MSTRKLSRKKIFYVYALLDPRKPGPFYYGHWKFSHEPFYIGKGKENRHIKTLLNDSTNRHKHNKISKIRREGYEPIVSIKRNTLTESQSISLEIKFIAKIGRSDLKIGPLTNLTDGGEGHSGFIPSMETREKRSASLIGIERKPFSAEHLSNISIAQRNRPPMSKRTKKLISIAGKGRVVENSTRLKISLGNKGKPKSATACSNMSKSKLGKPWTEAQHAAHKNRKWTKARYKAYRLKYGV